MNIKFNKSSGAISRVLIMITVLVIIGIIVAYAVARFASVKNQGKNNQPPGPPEPPKPVYETIIGDVKFSFQSAEDLGNLLEKTTYEKDLTTTEKFIRVVVGAQNKGKNNIAQFSWDVGNIVDSDGRNFITINDKAYSHLPKPDTCGALLKPEFSPVPCVKYYEVSRESKGLKVIIKTTQPKKQESMLDLYFSE